MEEKEAFLQQSKEEIVSLQTQLEELRTQQSSLQDKHALDLEKINSQLDESTEQCKNLNAQLMEQMNLVATKSEEIEALKSQVENLKSDQDAVSKVNGESL